MQTRQPTPIMERIRYGTYGVAAGLFIGMMMGWMFHGLVGAVVRLGLLLIVVIPVCLAVYFWLKVNAQNRVSRSEPVVREAEWWDVSEPRK